MNLSQAVLIDHALNQMVRRQVTADNMRRVLAAPEQVMEVCAGRVVAQGMTAG